jgi:hypothetical protein
MSTLRISVNSAPIKMAVSAAQGPDSGGGGTTLTSYATQIETLADYPLTFPPATHTHAQLHDAATVSGNGISISGQEISLSIGTTAGTIAAGDDSRIVGALQAADIAGKANIDAETHTGAHVFSSTTRPTSAGTGTPEATSLITRADGDARYGQEILSVLGSDYTHPTENTSFAGVLAITLPAGTWRLEILLNSTSNFKTQCSISPNTAAVTGNNGFWNIGRTTNANVAITAGGMFNSTSGTGAAGNGGSYMVAVITLTQETTITAQAAQNTLSTTPTVVYAKSFALARKIA